MAFLPNFLRNNGTRESLGKTILTAQSAQVRLDSVGEPVCPSHRDTTSQNKQSLTRPGYKAGRSKIELLPQKLPFEDLFRLDSMDGMLMLMASGRVGRRTQTLDKRYN